MLGMLAGQPVSRAQQKAESVIGAIVSIDANNRSAILKTDAGTSIAVKTDENTVCLRIPAGEKTLAKATPIQFADNGHQITVSTDTVKLAVEKHLDHDDEL